MQERIRYYITKSGEELTVRSVKVAKSPERHDNLDASIADEGAETRSPAAPVAPLARAMRRRMNSPVPGRSTES
jgi:hypothetical protein